MIAQQVPDGVRWASLLTEWRIEPVTLALVAIAGWTYARMVRRATALGSPPSRWRSAAFFVGLAVLLVALVSPVDAYAEALLTVHMAQHLLLAMVAAPLLALGAPIDLALRTAGPDGRRRVAPALRSRAGRLLAHPVAGWAAFVGVTYGVHFSGLYEGALEREALHLLEHALFVASALLYWWPIVGTDPLPRSTPHPVRLLSLVLLMPAMSFAALAIFSAEEVLYPWYARLPQPWGPGALADQRNAAVLMWLAGNLAIVVAILLVAAAWKRSEDERQRRLEAHLDRIGEAAAT